MRHIIFLTISLLFSYSVLAEEDNLKFLDFKQTEFYPSQGKKFAIPFELKTDGDIVINIYTPDNELVRSIKSEKLLTKGQHNLFWDGKDEKGNVVADEAYMPVVTLTTKDGKKFELDKRDTGGEVIESLKLRITPEKNMSFKLPSPARVMARAGIKGGPMLRSLENWKVKNKGNIVLRWNGYDQDGLVDIRDNKKLSVMARAYRLPEYSIISLGNTNINYRDYRNSLSNKNNPEANKKMPLERNGKRIEKHYYLPKDMNLSPKISVDFIDQYPKDKQGNPIVDCPCGIRVDMEKEDKPQLQESLYEIAFFIDNEFISEQEQGYVPLTWRWKPSNLKPGQHLLTVNVSGLRGEVGVKSLVFVSK